MRCARPYGVASPDALDDLIQEAYLKLCADNYRVLRDFHSDHPEAFFGYLKVVTSNVVRDHFRLKLASKRGGLQVAVPADDVEAETAESQQVERNILLHQIEAVIERQISGPTRQRDRQVFWLYYRQGLTSAAIAELPSIGLSSKGVESLLQRLTRMVREELATPPRKAKGAAKGSQGSFSS